MSETAVLEQAEVVDIVALKQRCLGNLALVERILKKFTTQLNCDLAELEKAARIGDAESFALVAHRIKGMYQRTDTRALNVPKNIL